jgi:hypothetical protein
MRPARAGAFSGPGGAAGSGSYRRCPGRRSSASLRGLDRRQGRLELAAPSTVRQIGVEDPASADRRLVALDQLGLEPTNRRRPAIE